MDVSVIRRILIGGGGIFKFRLRAFLQSFISLFQLNAHNMLNTYTYHQLPLICFCVCYTKFIKTIALLAAKLYECFSVVGGCFYERRPI